MWCEILIANVLRKTTSDDFKTYLKLFSKHHKFSILKIILTHSHEHFIMYQSGALKVFEL